jgi:hypothetical protein
MAVLGLTDPWIIASYIGCFVCVAIAWGYALFKKEKKAEEESDE